MHSRRACVRLCTVNSGIKVRGICNLNPLFRSNNDDCGRVVDAEAKPERTVCFDLRRTTAGWIDNEGHLLTMRLKPPASKLLQVILTRDHSLVGKYWGLQVSLSSP